MKTVLTTKEQSEFLNEQDIVSEMSPTELHEALLEQLHTGVAHFIYMKGKNGDEPREAFGTLNPDTLKVYLGEREETTAEQKETPIEVVNQSYFDLDAVNKDGSKGAFRMFKISNLIAVF